MLLTTGDGEVLYWAILTIGALILLQKVLFYGSRPKGFPPGRTESHESRVE